MQPAVFLDKLKLKHQVDCLDSRLSKIKVALEARLVRLDNQHKTHKGDCLVHPRRQLHRASTICCSHHPLLEYNLKLVHSASSSQTDFLVNQAQHHLVKLVLAVSLVILQDS